MSSPIAPWHFPERHGTASALLPLPRGKGAGGLGSFTRLAARSPMAYVTAHGTQQDSAGAYETSAHAEGGSDDSEPGDTDLLWPTVGDAGGAHPEKAAIIFVPQEGEERTVTWREFDRASNRMARLLAERGVRRAAARSSSGCRTARSISSPAARSWKLGALVAAAARAILPAARARRHPRNRPARRWSSPMGRSALSRPPPGRAGRWRTRTTTRRCPTDPPHPGKAIASGGSTGRSKIIVAPGPGHAVRGAPARSSRARLRRRAGATALRAALPQLPLPERAISGLCDDHTLVLMERFDAARAVGADRAAPRQLRLHAADHHAADHHAARRARARFLQHRGDRSPAARPARRG